jgi:uncharacterized membrane protein
MAKKKLKNKKEEKDEGDSKVFAFLATFLSIVGFIIALLAKRDDKYVMYYAKQSLVVFIAALIAWALGGALMWVPILGRLISFLISTLVVVLWIFSVIYSLSGEEKETPVIGKYARKIRI